MPADSPTATVPNELAERLGFTPPEANGFQRLLQRRAAWPPMSRFSARVLEPIDSTLAGWTGGRLTVPRLFAGMPVAFLTTVGAKTGQSRRHPLAPIPFEDGIGLLGTNFGRNIMPSWAINLRANPDAEITYRSTTVAVRAEPVDGERLGRLIEAGIPIFSGFAVYPSRITERDLPGFVLRPRD